LAKKRKGPNEKSIASQLCGEMTASQNYFTSKMVASWSLAWSIMLCPLAELELWPWFSGGSKIVKNYDYFQQAI